MIRKHLWLVLVASVLVSLGASAPPSHLSRPAPSTYHGTALQLSGTLIRVNECDALDVRDGPRDLSLVWLDWAGIESRRSWLQSECDVAVAQFGGDLWQAYVRLGGGLRQTSSAFAVDARDTGGTVSCGNIDLPIMRVEAVRGAVDLHTGRPLFGSVQPLVADGFDRDNGHIRRIVEAGRAALSGGDDTVTLEVEGVSERSYGCPPWALIDSRSVDYDCASRFGFVDLRFANPGLEPEPQRALERLMAREGVTALDDLDFTEAEALLERADRAARRGPFHYRGHYTGEVSYYRGTEALFLTPVFIVEGVE